PRAIEESGNPLPGGRLPRPVHAGRRDLRRRVLRLRARLRRGHPDRVSRNRPGSPSGRPVCVFLDVASLRDYGRTRTPCHEKLFRSDADRLQRRKRDRGRLSSDLWDWHRALTDAGFVVTDIVEPEPLPRESTYSDVFPLSKIQMIPGTTIWGGANRRGTTHRSGLRGPSLQLTARTRLDRDGRPTRSRRRSRCPAGSPSWARTRTRTTT